MNRVTVVVLSVILVLVIGLSGCNTTNPPADALAQPTTIINTVEVPMTGVHLERFDFHRGDSVAGKLTVQGKHPIDFSVVYYQSTGVKKDVEEMAMARVIDIEEMLIETFTFVAPVSTEYTFAFAGYYSKLRDTDWKSYSELYEKVTLELTIHHEG